MSLVRSATETVFGLRLRGQLEGVTDECTDSRMESEDGGGPVPRLPAGIEWA